MTTVVSGLHPLVTSALDAHGCGTLTSVQHQTLSRVTVGGSTVPPDCIVETPRGSGHCMCMVAYAAHFVHSQTGGTHPFAIVVARDPGSLQRTLAVSNVASIPAVRFVDATHLDAKSRIGSSACPLGSRVLVGTLQSLSNLDFGNAADARTSCVTLIVEEAAAGLADDGGAGGKNYAAATPALAEFINCINSLWPHVNLCLMSARPPSAIHASLRYLLRRNNRCYLPARSAVPVFSTIMCLSADDRSALCHRVTQIRGLRRVLILTHNREVRDLKTELHKALGLRTFAIQRATPQEERERVLTDFLECDYGVLVAMDAFTGVDLIDVDGVIQYYPPQKSMTDDEWSDYVSFLRTTGESNVERPRAVVVTLAATDDLSMIKHLQSRVGFTGPVLNISPNHVNFEDFVLQPNLAVLGKLPTEEEQEAAAGAASIVATRKRYSIVLRSGAAARGLGAGGSNSKAVRNSGGGAPAASASASAAVASAAAAAQQSSKSHQQQQRQYNNNSSSSANNNASAGFQDDDFYDRPRAKRSQIRSDAAAAGAAASGESGGNNNNNRLAIPAPSSGGAPAAGNKSNRRDQQHADPAASDDAIVMALPKRSFQQNPQNQQQTRRQQQQQHNTTVPSSASVVAAAAAAVASEDLLLQPSSNKPRGKQQNSNQQNRKDGASGGGAAAAAAAAASSAAPASENKAQGNKKANNSNSNSGGAAADAAATGDNDGDKKPRRQWTNNNKKSQQAPAAAGSQAK